MKCRCCAKRRSTAHDFETTVAMEEHAPSLLPVDGIMVATAGQSTADNPIGRPRIVQLMQSYWRLPSVLFGPRRHDALLPHRVEVKSPLCPAGSRYSPGKAPPQFRQKFAIDGQFRIKERYLYGMHSSVDANITLRTYSH